MNKNTFDNLLVFGMWGSLFLGTLLGVVLAKAPVSHAMIEKFEVAPPEDEIFFGEDESYTLDAYAVRCIVGEAADQGPEGMLSIASAIRNRGNFQGVNGCYAKHVDYEEEDIFEIAIFMWFLAEKVDYVDGADEWRSTRNGEADHIDGANNMLFIKQVRDHKFYRKLKEK